MTGPLPWISRVQLRTFTETSLLLGRAGCFSGFWWKCLHLLTKVGKTHPGVAQVVPGSLEMADGTVTSMSARILLLTWKSAWISIVRSVNLFHHHHIWDSSLSEECLFYSFRLHNHFCLRRPENTWAWFSVYIVDFIWLASNWRSSFPSSTFLSPKEPSWLTVFWVFPKPQPLWTYGFLSWMNISWLL